MVVKKKKKTSASKTKAGVEKPILDSHIENTADDYYYKYSMEVIEDRAIFGEVDGLKPVTRRGLWAGYELGVGHRAKYVKAAKLVGDTMGNYHPHGDCLEGSTLVPLTDGSYKTIKELCEIGEDQEVYAFDVKKKKLRAVIAHSFRIGQITSNIYTITLLNGTVLKVTKNHPFLVEGKEWKRADNLQVGDRLTSVHAALDNSGYRYFVGEDVAGNSWHYAHRLVARDLTNLKKRLGENIHHKNNQKLDNSSSNFELMSNEKHAKLHGDYKKGLKAGLDRMYHGDLSEAMYICNSEKMKEVNSKMWLLKAVKAVEIILDRKLKVNSKNYESIREEGLVYNQTRYTTLKERKVSLSDIRSYIKHKKEHGVYPFHDMSKSIGHLGGKQKERDQKDCKLYNRKVSRSVGKILQNLIQDEREFSSYDDYAFEICNHNVKNMISGSIESLQKYYSSGNMEEVIENLDLDHTSLITDIKVVKTNPTKMYDFTVDKYENMFITTENNTKAWVCAHNSSIYEAFVTAANSPIPMIDGSGNWGTMTDDAAAPRYTKARLSLYSDLVFFDRFYLPVVDKVLNYDESRHEPLVLPALLPNALINGNFGIAPGVRANSPIVRFDTLIKALLKSIPDGASYETCKHIELVTKYGGLLHRNDDTKMDMKNFLRTGAGRFLFDCRYTETSSHEMRVDGFPFANLPPTLLEKLENVNGVAGVRDDSSKTDRNIAFVITFKKVGEGDLILAKKAVLALFRTAATFNMQAIERKLDENGIAHKKLNPTNIPKLLDAWLDYRVALEKRACQYWIDKRAKEIERLELMVLAVQMRDFIIKALSKKFDDEQLANHIAKGLKITVEQANIILDLKIRALKALEEDRLKKQIKSLKEEIGSYKQRIKKPKDYITNHVKEISKKLSAAYVEA